MASAGGIELKGPIEGRFAEILTPAALDFVAGLQRELGATRAALLRRRAERQATFDAGGRLDFLAETRGIRDEAWTVAPAPEGSPAPVGRAHGPGRAEDGHQRAQLGRGRLHGGLRGREHADLAQHGPGPGQPRRRRRPHDRAPEPGRPRLPPERADRDPARPAPRVASPGAPLPGGRPGRVGEPLRLRALRLPQRPAAARARERALLLPPQAREPPRGAALERRVRLRRDPARAPEGRDPRHRARRDHPGRVRDGRDPVGAAGPLGRAQRGPLGLHVQPHQEVPDPAHVRPAGPRPGDDDGAVHARVHRAAREDLPPPRRARARRDGRVHPQPARPPGQRGRPGAGAGGQGPRIPGRLRRHVGRPSRSRVRSRASPSRDSSATARTSSSGSAPRWPRTPRRCWTSGSRAGA